MEYEIWFAQAGLARRSLPREIRWGGAARLLLVAGLAACWVGCGSSEGRPVEEAAPGVWVEVHGGVDPATAASFDVNHPPEVVWAPVEPFPVGHAHHGASADLLIDAVVGSDGRVAAFRCLDESPHRRALERHAAFVLREWRFRAAEQGGRSVPSRLSVSLHVPAPDPAD